MGRRFTYSKVFSIQYGLADSASVVWFPQETSACLLSVLRVGAKSSNLLVRRALLAWLAAWLANDLVVQVAFL